MRHHPSVIPAAVVGFALLLLALAASPPGERSPGPLLIAHVDLERVFNEINPKSQAEVELEQTRLRCDKRKEELRNEVELLKGDLELLVPGTEQYQKAERKLRDAAIAYSAWVEFAKAKIEHDRAEARKEIYEQIGRSSASFAQARGFGYLVSDDSSRKVEEGNELQIIQQMAFRRLLYAEHSFDVTDELIEWINSGK